MSLYSGDPANKSSSAAVKEDFMFAANRGSRLFQKEGEIARSVHDLPIRGLGLGESVNGSWNSAVCNDVEDEEEDVDLEDEGALEGRNFEKDGNLAEKVCQETPDQLQSQSSFGMILGIVLLCVTRYDILFVEFTMQEYDLGIVFFVFLDLICNSRNIECGRQVRFLI